MPEPEIDSQEARVRAAYWMGKNREELLKTHLNRWVAYTENGMVGSGESYNEVLSKVEEQGIDKNSFIIEKLMPLPSPEVKASIGFPYKPIRLPPKI